MVKLIIFSKDRASQLDAHLQSVFANDNRLFSSIDVIYVASDEKFQAGYDKLIKEWVDPLTPLRFHLEYDFRIQLLDLLDNSTEEFTCFGVDDNIIYREIQLDQWDLLKVLGDNEICISLRLGTNTFMQCHYTNQMAHMPKWVCGVGIKRGELLKWAWRECPSFQNFGYPLSVDYHIFQSKVIETILKGSQFSNPNSLECAVQQHLSKLPPYMLCPTQSNVVNLPLNRVQNVCENNFGQFEGYDQITLNNMYLDGYRISIEKMDFSGVNCSHQEIPLVHDMVWSRECG